MSTQSDEHSESQVLAYSRFAARIPRYLTMALAYSRPLAYASEVGESFRKVLPRLITPLYALSIGYVFVDIGTKNYNVRDKPADYRKYFLLDLSLWHLGASIVFPAVCINRFVHGTTYLMNKLNFGNKAIIYIPAVMAICLIPFIVHPLDHGTDYLMDNTFRRYINFKQYDLEKGKSVDKHH